MSCFVKIGKFKSLYQLNLVEKFIVFETWHIQGNYISSRLSCYDSFLLVYLSFIL